MTKILITGANGQLDSYFKDNRWMTWKNIESCCQTDYIIN